MGGEFGPSPEEMGINTEISNQDPSDRLAKIRDSRARLLAQKELANRRPEYKVWEEIGKAVELEEMYRWLEENPLHKAVPDLLDDLSDLERDVQRGTTTTAEIKDRHGDAEKYGSEALLEKTKLTNGILEHKLIPILIKWDEAKRKSEVS